MHIAVEVCKIFKELCSDWQRASTTFWLTKWHADLASEFFYDRLSNKSYLSALLPNHELQHGLFILLDYDPQLSSGKLVLILFSWLLTLCIFCWTYFKCFCMLQTKQLTFFSLSSFFGLFFGFCHFCTFPPYMFLFLLGVLSA